MSIKDCFQELFHLKGIHGLVFKKFRIPVCGIDLGQGDAFSYYAGIRFKWLTWLICKLTGCKYRWWADVRQDVGENYIARRCEKP